MGGLDCLAGFPFSWMTSTNQIKSATKTANSPCVHWFNRACTKGGMTVSRTGLFFSIRYSFSSKTAQKVESWILKERLGVVKTVSNPPSFIPSTQVTNVTPTTAGNLNHVDFNHANCADIRRTIYDLNRD